MLHLPKSARYSSGSRGPGPRMQPAVIAGMAIAACLAIVVYWHLVSEYRALEERYRELQEKFHLYVEKKDALQQQYKELQTVSQDASKRIEDTKIRLDTCEKERETLEKALREKQRQLDGYVAKNVLPGAPLALDVAKQQQHRDPEAADATKTKL